MSGRIEKLSFDALLEIVKDEKMNTEKARQMAADEILRRVKLIEEQVEEISKDERLGYPTATVFENAPLALVQCGLENQTRTLRWVLRALLFNVVEKTNG